MAETPLTDSIEALTTYANQVTGASDTNLSDAVYTLAQGYGGGSLPSDIDAIKTGTITFSTATRIDNYPVAHGLGSVPDFYIVYPVSVPAELGTTWLGNFYSNKTSMASRLSALIEFYIQNNVEGITLLNYAETSYPAPTATEFYLQTSSPSSRVARASITYKWMAIKLK